MYIMLHNNTTYMYIVNRFVYGLQYIYPNTRVIPVRCVSVGIRYPTMVGNICISSVDIVY